MNCEIRHEILLVTGYMSYKSGEGLVLDFGGPSDSFYCLFLSWKFLNTIVCYRKCCHLGGDHDPQPSFDPPLLIMKHEVLVAIHL